MYAFECRDDSKNKMKRIRKFQSKNPKFDDYKNCFDGNDYKKKCDNYNIRSVNHEMYLQKV